jgi:hypothetical protein
MKIIDASMGFKATLWRVSGPDKTRMVYALDNYTAAAAAGFRFDQCDVEEVKSVGGVS